MNINPKKPTHVFAIKRNGKVYRYMARISKGSFRIYLGCFEKQSDAVLAVEDYYANPKKYEKRVSGR
jgi:hypothetical protein